MDLLSLIGGLFCFASGLFFFVIANKRINKDDLDYSTVSGYGVSALLAIAGFIMIAKELAKII